MGKSKKKKTGRTKNAAAKPKPQETVAAEVSRERTAAGHIWVWGVLVIVILFAAVVRYGLADVPMERDEGEYAYAGRLILDGIPPFAEAYNMKMPGVYGAYAVIMSVLGQTDTAVRLGLIVVNAATALLLFLAFRRRMDEPEALAGTAGFAAITLLPSFQGFMANAEHFVVLFAALGMYLLLIGLDIKKWWLVFLGGVGFGLAFMMKQHGALFILFGGLYLIWSIRKEPKAEWLKQAVIYGVGAVIPFAVTCLIMAKAGILGKFYYWTFAYAGEYASMVDFSQGMSYLARRIGTIGGDVPW